MNYGFIDITLAKKKMRVKGNRGSVVLLSTIWRGEVITCVYNAVSKEVVNVFCIQKLDSDDLAVIDSIIYSFLFEVHAKG